MNEYYVTCAVCGKQMKKITIFHLKTHKISSFGEYSLKYNVTIFTSDETRNKIRKSNTGKKLSLEHIEKLRLINTGRKHTKEAIKKISDAGKGRKHTAESKKKLSDAHTGKVLSEEHKIKLRGQVRNAEIRHNISVATKAALNKPEVKLKLGKAMLGKKHSKETIEKIRNAHIGKVKTKEHCENLSRSLTGKKCSESHKEAMRRGHGVFKGIKSPRFGVPHTENTRIKISCNQRGIDINDFDGFISNKRYCIKFNENLKNRVRIYFNNVCFICGKTQYENGKRLSVHHVNYDKMICCNDVLPLLVPLCHGCHSSTGNRKVDWVGYFEYRLESEYDNKCFYTKNEYKLMGGDVNKIIVGL